MFQYMNEFLEEIQAQPQALKNTYDSLVSNQKDQIVKLRDTWRVKNINRVIFTGMGSSNFCGYIPFYYLNQLGIKAEMIEAGEFLIHILSEKNEKIFNSTALVLISQSGESGEIVKILKNQKDMQQVPLIIGITNTPDSYLAKQANLVFFTDAGDEKSVTSKTYTSCILLLYYLSIIIANDFEINSDKLNSLPKYIDYISEFFSHYKEIDLIIKSFLNFLGPETKFLEFLARGASLSTAYQSALNYKEIVKQPSEANPCSTFSHGCIEYLDEKSKIILFSSDNESFKLNNNLTTKMIRDWNCGRIIHICNETRIKTSPNPILSENGHLLTYVHDIENTFLAPIIEIILMQFLFYEIAININLEPGKFRHSQKITRSL